MSNVHCSSSFSIQHDMMLKLIRVNCWCIAFTSPPVPAFEFSMLNFVCWNRSNRMFTSWCGFRSQFLLVDYNTLAVVFFSRRKRNSSTFNRTVHDMHWGWCGINSLWLLSMCAVYNLNVCDAPLYSLVTINPIFFCMLLLDFSFKRRTFGLNCAVYSWFAVNVKHRIQFQIQPQKQISWNSMKKSNANFANYFHCIFFVNQAFDSIISIELISCLGDFFFKICFF